MDGFIVTEDLESPLFDPETPSTQERIADALERIADALEIGCRFSGTNHLDVEEHYE